MNLDNGHSGQSFDRPGFKRMLADLDSGKINCCISKDLSRLGRNAIDSGYYIEKHFPAIGVRYIAITDNYDSVDGQSGGIMLSLKNMMNEIYAIETGRKVSKTAQMNISNGKYIGAFPPYGYLKCRNDCHQLIVDTNTAHVVQYIFEMAADGHKYTSILAWLNNSNIMPPRCYFNSIGMTYGKAKSEGWWSYRAVRSILSNRVYCGDMVQGKSKVTGGIQTKLPESEWTITQDTHEAIVSRELFNSIQELPKKNVAANPRFKSPNTENVFARKLFCGQCGFALIRNRKTEKVYNFSCSTGSHYTKEACSGLTIAESVLKSIVLDTVQKYSMNIEQDSLLSKDTTVGCVSDSKKPLSELIWETSRELDNNKHFLRGLYESLVIGDLSDAEFKEMKTLYETKIATLTGQLEDLRRSEYHCAEQNMKLSQAHADIRAIVQASDLTAEIVDNLIEKIYVSKHRNLEIKFKFLDEVVSIEGGITV